MEQTSLLDNTQLTRTACIEELSERANIDRDIKLESANEPTEVLVDRIQSSPDEIIIWRQEY